jgi:hypothetical protein
MVRPRRREPTMLRETVAEIIGYLDEIGIGTDEPISGPDAVELLNSIWRDLKLAYEWQS